MSRQWTEDVVHENGGRTITVKTACNGCDLLLGDITDDEITDAIAGLPRADVRSECPVCSLEEHK